jgi:hypothetical protein
METMTEQHVALTPTEHEYLVNLLKSMLGETWVEARHTRGPDFHDRVLREGDLIRGLLAKLGWQPESGPA